MCGACRLHLGATLNRCHATLDQRQGDSSPSKRHGPLNQWKSKTDEPVIENRYVDIQYIFTRKIQKVCRTLCFFACFLGLIPPHDGEKAQLTPPIGVPYWRVNNPTSGGEMPLQTAPERSRTAPKLPLLGRFSELSREKTIRKMR